MLYMNLGKQCVEALNFELQLGIHLKLNKIIKASKNLIKLENIDILTVLGGKVNIGSQGTTPSAVKSCNFEKNSIYKNCLA